MKLVKFFDGEQSSQFIFKKEYLYTDLKIKRDLTNSETSSLLIYDDKNIIVAGDFIYIPNFHGINILGIVTNVESDKSLIKTVNFKFGADIYTNPLYIPNNTLVPSFIESNYSPLKLDVQSTTAITATDQLLETDVAVRQLMRATTTTEIVDDINNGIVIRDVVNPVYSFRADDPDISSLDVKLALDSYNILRLYNEEDLTQFQTYYLGINGGVTTNIANAQRPAKMSFEVVTATEYNSLSFATSKIRSQEYDNYINFDVIFSTNSIPLQFGNDFLGRKVKIYINGYTISTIISAYEIENDLKINITLGLSRKRLTSILKQEKER